jgi:hypothetical protein
MCNCTIYIPVGLGFYHITARVFAFKFGEDFLSDGGEPALQY